MSASVHHEPWPLCEVTVVDFEESLTADVGLAPPESEPLVQYSPGVRVRLGPPRPVRRTAAVGLGPPYFWRMMVGVWSACSMPSRRFFSSPRASSRAEMSTSVSGASLEPICGPPGP